MAEAGKEGFGIFFDLEFSSVRKREFRIGSDKFSGVALKIFS